MRHLDMIRKSAAIGFSVLLVGGFISYRAGAFDWLNSPPAVEPSSEPLAPVAADPLPQVVQNDPTMFSSSKSIILAPANPGSPKGSTAAPPSPPVVLPGSKSSGVFTPDLDLPVRPTAPASPPATTPPQTPPIIGGSKSLAPLIPPAPQKPNSPPAESGPPR